MVADKGVGECSPDNEIKDTHWSRSCEATVVKQMNKGRQEGTHTHTHISNPWRSHLLVVAFF